MLRFSVLMSLYKNENPEYLRESLDSLLNQTILPSEILIVKDGLLTEELENVLQEYESKSNLFRFLPFEKNRGLGLALRDGVIACKNEYIARMDTDDIADPKRFEMQMYYLEQNPSIALLGSWSKEFDSNPEKPYAVVELPCSNDEILSFAKKRNPFRHPTVIFKKSAVLASGNYRDFLWFEDYDLFVRIMLRGYKVANLPNYLVSVRADGNQFARRGGINYARQDILFQITLYRYGFIGVTRFVINTVIRILVRILPNKLRTFLYVHFLRRKENVYA